MFVVKNLRPPTIDFSPILIQSQVDKVLWCNEEACAKNAIDLFWIFMLQIVDDDLIRKRNLQKLLLTWNCVLCIFQIESVRAVVDVKEYTDFIHIEFIDVLLLEIFTQIIDRLQRWDLFFGQVKEIAFFYP